MGRLNPYCIVAVTSAIVGACTITGSTVTSSLTLTTISQDLQSPLEQIWFDGDMQDARTSSRLDVNCEGRTACDSE
jgi:hypothetical protein